MGFGRKATGEGAIFITLFPMNVINLTWPFDVDLDHWAELSRFFFAVKLLSPTSAFHMVLFGRRLLCSDHNALRRECLHKLAGIFLNGRLACLLLSTQQILLCHFFLWLWDRCEIVAGGDGVREKIGKNSHQFWIEVSQKRSLMPLY